LLDPAYTNIRFIEGNFEHKKGESLPMNQFSHLVTPKVEKSNFYKDLEGVIDYKN